MRSKRYMLPFLGHFDTNFSMDTLHNSINVNYVAITRSFLLNAVKAMDQIHRFSLLPLLELQLGRCIEVRDEFFRILIRQINLELFCNMI